VRCRMTPVADYTVQYLNFKSHKIKQVLKDIQHIKERFAPLVMLSPHILTLIKMLKYIIEKEIA